MYKIPYPTCHCLFHFPLSSVPSKCVTRVSHKPFRGEVSPDHDGMITCHVGDSLPHKRGLDGRSSVLCCLVQRKREQEMQRNDCLSLILSRGGGEGKAALLPSIQLPHRKPWCPPISICTTNRLNEESFWPFWNTTDLFIPLHVEGFVPWKERKKAVGAFNSCCLSHMGGLTSSSSSSSSPPPLFYQ